MIWDGGLRHRHAQTLTVEPGFKSSGFVPELMTIGVMARQAHIATSAIRWIERRGLLSGFQDLIRPPELAVFRSSSAIQSRGAGSGRIGPPGR